MAWWLLFISACKGIQIFWCRHLKTLSDCAREYLKEQKTLRFRFYSASQQTLQMLTVEFDHLFLYAIKRVVGRRNMGICCRTARCK